MRRRPSSRVLLVDPAGRVLLFHFVFRSGALAGERYWATPGGALHDGESFEQAAIRELWEETGIRVDRVGQVVAERQFPMTLTSGERVLADERLYLVRAGSTELSRSAWTEAEHDVIAEHRWWTVAELEATGDTVYPEDLPALLRTNGG